MGKKDERALLEWKAELEAAAKWWPKDGQGETVIAQLVSELQAAAESTFGVARSQWRKTDVDPRDLAMNRRPLGRTIIASDESRSYGTALLFKRKDGVTVLVCVGVSYTGDAGEVSVRDVCDVVVTSTVAAVIGKIFEQISQLQAA